MAEQPFEVLVARPAPLLEAVEQVVVDAHRRWHEERRSGPWSPPVAYRWLRFEDTDPIGKLVEGAGKLGPVTGLDAASVEALIRQADGLGYRERSASDDQRK